MIKPYPKYKDTNVSWLSNLPEHWEARKLSRSIKLIGSGTTPKSGKDEYYKNGTINWLLTGDLNDSYIYNTSKKITPKAIEDYSTLKNYPKGSIVMAMYGATIGKLGILKIDSTTNQACCVLSDNELFLNKFIYYHLLAIRKDIINLSFGGGQPNISQDIIKSLKLSCPPIEEQDKIVDFLDKKTKEIDQSISDKNQLIQLYEEEKQAIINNAVTKGLDNNAELKETGVEWLGSIPKHWNYKKLKYVADVFPSNIDKKSKDKEKEVYLCNYMDVYNNDYIHKDLDFMKATASNDQIEKFKLRIGDVLATKDSESPDDIGIPALVIEDFDDTVLGYHTTLIRAFDSDILSSYIFNLMRSSKLNAHFEISARGITRFGLSVSAFKDVVIPIPPKEEQKSIVSYIEQKLKSIKTNVSLILDEIELLKEYKQALIYEAVTGKIDVRDKITD